MNGSAAALGGRSQPFPIGPLVRGVRRMMLPAAWAASVAAVLACVALIALPSFGLLAGPMLSGSMRDVLPVGSLVVVRPVSATTVHVGEMVMFHAPGYNGDYTHRIHAITGTPENRVFITKGDKNPGVDPWRLHSIDGRGRFGEVVADVPYLGYAVAYSHDWRVRLALVLIACVAVGVSVLRGIWRRSESNA